MTLYTLVALFLVCMAMRFQLSVLAPLLPRIEAELATTHEWGGLLTALSFAMMGIGSIAASATLRSVGAARGVLLASLAIAVCGAVRAAAPDASLVLAVGVPLGLAVGIETALMPVVARERFKDRAGLAAGVAVAGLSIGSAFSAAVAVPAADFLGGWRETLVVLAVAGTLSALPWLVVAARSRGESVTYVRPLPRLPRSGLAWSAIAIYSIQSIIFFGLGTWLPSAYVEREWPETAAGLLVSALIVSSLLGSIVVTPVPEGRSTDAALSFAAIAALAGSIGFIVLPGIGWVWTAVVGAATGALFVLSVRLPTEIAPDLEAVAAVSAYMFAVGYILAAAAPVALGKARDATGTFAQSFVMLAAVAVALLAVSAWFVARRSRAAASA